MVLTGVPQDPRCDFCSAPPVVAYDCGNFNMHGLVLQLKGGGELPVMGADARVVGEELLAGHHGVIGRPRAPPAGGEST